VLFLITQPAAIAKLQTELNQAEQRGLISNPVITFEEAKALPYLQACVKEGLRIWPPVMGLMQKVVPPAGESLNGQFVPGGTQIGYCAWGVHRNPAIFGKDAEMFRPDRWLEADEEQLEAMNRTHDLVFGSGRYACLGKPVALIELSKAIAEVRVIYNQSVAAKKNADFFRVYPVSDLPSI
jgi:cytochrome P450